MPPRWTAIAVIESKLLVEAIAPVRLSTIQAGQNKFIQCCVTTKLKSLKRSYPMVDERDTSAGRVATFALPSKTTEIYTVSDRSNVSSTCRSPDIGRQERTISRRRTPRHSWISDSRVRDTLEILSVASGCTSQSIGPGAIFNRALNRNLSTGSLLITPNLAQLRCSGLWRRECNVALRSG